MIYGFSLLFLLLSLVLGIPALRQLLRMRAINRNPGVTPGQVTSNSSSLGWLWTASFGSVNRPLIRYQSPRGSEMVLEVADSSMFTNHRYNTGDNVEVVYDRDMPGRAYARPEWPAALREMTFSIISLVVAILLWIVGRMTTPLS